MTPSEEVLMAYADGELDDDARRQVEQAAAADPEVARRVAAHRALRTTLRTGFDSVLEEPVPQRLTALLRDAAPHPAPTPVLPFARKTTARGTWVHRGALAASFLLGALVWNYAARVNRDGMISERHGEFVAAGGLAQALDGQLVAQQDPNAAVRIGVSFRSTQGTFCRTFDMHAGVDTAGLACHANGQWALQVLARDVAARPQGEYRPAGSDLPASVVRAVNDSIAGEPLDSAAEAAARAAGWTPRPSP